MLMAISPSWSSASESSSRWHGSRICSGCITWGNMTKLGNGMIRAVPENRDSSKVRSSVFQGIMANAFLDMGFFGVGCFCR